MTLTRAFFADIRKLIVSARATVARGVDLVQVHTNFEVGRRIVEQEQRGKGRAAYGKEVITALAERLTSEFGKGFSASNLAYMRSFYLVYQSRFALSWTHYVFLLGIDNAEERSFYEIEAGRQDWTVRELKRQFDSSLRSTVSQFGGVRTRQPREARKAHPETSQAKPDPERRAELTRQGHYLALIRQVSKTKRASFKDIFQKKGGQAAIDALKTALGK